MVLNNGKKEIELKFKTEAYMNLRSKLKCENLRETLIANCNRGDFQTLAEGLKVFSDGEIGQIGDAYTCIDHYCEANDISRRDMFVAFIVELGEHGFFEDQKTKEEIKEMVSNPYLDLMDTKDLQKQAMEIMKSKMAETVAEYAANTMMTGANTSMQSA